jgi:ElaB/YqjD/DUF883 family membrane-anchored ribosome-binding protein
MMEAAMAMYADPRERLVSDVKLLLADTEEFLLAVGAESKDKIAGIRPRLEAAMQRARSQAAEVQAAVEARAREGARRVETYASENPWQTAGMAAAVGAAVGAVIAVLLSRN